MIDNTLSNASLQLGRRSQAGATGARLTWLRDIELDASIDAHARGIDLGSWPARGQGLITA